MFVVICNGTQNGEGNYVHSNFQQFTDSGGFLCALQCITVHRQWKVPMFMVICNNTQRIEVTYVHCNLQQYTNIGGF
jgi:hypothetical protein